MQKISVVAAVLDVGVLTLYKTDGTTVILKQPDPRIPTILEVVVPICSKNEIAEIDLDSGSNAFAEFESKSGLIRFFRIAKKKILGLFGSEEVPEHIEAGVVPAQELKLTQREKDFEQQSKIANAVDEILANSQPIAETDVRDISEHETVVAVVGNKMVPGVETLGNHFRDAAEKGNTRGMENFIRRLTAVINKRLYSVQDLLKFLEKADLPIADDGSIIAYKRLYSSKDHFVDPHTRQVRQKVGSIVCMDESMVDPNRRNECSNGLHIGTRQYMPNFSGDAMFLVKINPEDVIAVPEYDSSKMRVCAYHILFELAPAAKQLIMSRKPLSSNEEGANLLARALRGNYPPAIEEVRITAAKGGGLKITPIRDGKLEEVVAITETIKAVDDRPDEDPEIASFVDPKAVAKQISESKPAPAPKAEPTPEPEPTQEAPVETRNQKAQRLYNAMKNGKALFDRQAAANELQDLKRKAKVGWVQLKLPVGTNDEIAAVIKPIKKEKPVETKANAALVEAAKEAEKLNEPIEVKSAAPRSRQEEARHLFDLAAKGDKASWGHLWAHKKKAKISWEALGFNAREIERIKTNKPDHI